MVFLKFEVVNQTVLFEAEESGRALFELGAAFKAQLDEQNKTVFDEMDMFEDWPAVQQCVALHDEWTAAARAAVHCWTMVGKRNKVVKDMRKKIAQLVWENRVVWKDP